MCFCKPWSFFIYLSVSNSWRLTHNPMRTLQLESHKDTFNSPVVRSMQHVSNLSRLGFVPCLAAFHLSCSKRTQTLSDLIPRALLVISTHPRKNYRVPCELEIRIPRRHRISQGIRIFWIKATSRAAKPRYPLWAKKGHRRWPK